MQDGHHAQRERDSFVSPHLVVGSEKQEILVRADAELVRRNCHQHGQGECTGAKLEDLPLNGRNFSRLGLFSLDRSPNTWDSRKRADHWRDGQSYSVMANVLE